MPSDRRVPMLNAETLAASLIAADAHAGQTDKSGRAYISHPVRVALRVPPKFRPLALLHDVLEDTNTTVGELMVGGISHRTVDSVRFISKRYDDPKETNREYRERILDCGPIDVLVVKLADVTDNLDPRRGWVPPPDMAQQYRTFRRQLIKKLCEQFDIRLIAELQDLGTINPNECRFDTGGD